MAFLIAIILSLFPAALPQTAPSIKDVAWMTGCWELTRNGRHITEQWMPHEGGTMIGMSRTVAGGKTSTWEFLMIREASHGLDYFGKPSGQAEATFSAAAVTGSEVAFDNPAHDFP